MRWRAAISIIATLARIPTLAHMSAITPSRCLSFTIVPVPGGARGRWSWNFTPDRSVNSHVVSFSAFQEVASPGWSRSAVSHRVSES